MAKIVEGVSDFTVSIYDNGFTLQYSGNDAKGEWADAKIIVSDFDKLCDLMRGVVELPRK